MRPCCGLDLENRTQSFCMALRLMMMHHNSKFGNKMSCGLEEIIWTNTDILNPCLVLECSHPFFPKDTLAYEQVPSDQVWLRRISSTEDIVEKVIVDHMIHCCDLDLKTAENFFLHDTLAHDATSQYRVW